MPLLKSSEEKETLSPQGQAFVDDIDVLADEVWYEARGAVPTLAQAPENAKGAKRVSAVFFIATVVLCLLLTAVFVLSNNASGLFGLRFFVEPTNAMAPNIPRGSLLITTNRSPALIDAGDIITYYALPGEPESRLTRIVHQRVGETGNYRFRTSRPGSQLPDSIEIQATNVLGVRVAVLPHAGFVVSFIHTYAVLMAILAAMLCTAAVLMRKWMRPIKPRRKEPGDVFR